MRFHRNVRILATIYGTLLESSPFRESQVSTKNTIKFREERAERNKAFRSRMDLKGKGSRGEAEQGVNHGCETSVDQEFRKAEK